MFYADLSMSLLKRQVNEVLLELGLMNNQQDLGSVSCVSIILHHLLKELPIEVVSTNVAQILHLIEFSKDNSFGQVSFCNFYDALNLTASLFSFFQFVVLLFSFW